MSEKTYLRWYNKVGYGSGDVAGNVVYALLSFFVMIYLTDVQGMNPGVVGTIMMLSKFFDGASDFLFGMLMDRTRSRMGKARPWMLWGFLGCAAMIVAIFAIPVEMGTTAKYVWFGIAYTLLNAVFYTANNIAYSALTALVTRHANERVQMGAIRFFFAFGTSLVIQSVTVRAVDLLGGGAEGWRAVAVIYALVGLAANTIAVFSVRELPEEGPVGSEAEHAPESRIPFRQAMGLLLSNRYYILIVAVYIVIQLFGALNGMGIYFMTYVLHDPDLLAAFAWATNIPQMLALLSLPFVVARVGSMRRVSLWGYAVAVVARVGVIVGGYTLDVPVMLVFTAIGMLAIAPLQGTLTALVAEASEYTYLRSGKRLDGLMFSCTSLGTKIGGGVGTALSGWLLGAAGYVTASGGQVVEQPQSVISMLQVAYLWLPTLACVIVLVLVAMIDVEVVNRRLREEGDR